ncbi:MAG: four helix bundle protein [Candidatus Marinimicrobia bacterium]|nr:four helix bundle protein [Candidatus Neomarinimicrobiota bacterium]
MNSRELVKRSTLFAHRAVKLSLALAKDKLGRHISGQLIRCSTSVAANYRAAVLAQSRASFKAKLSIVQEKLTNHNSGLNSLSKKNWLNERMWRAYSRKLEN